MTNEENIENENVEKKGNWFTKQSTPVKVIIGIIAICCIGAIILVALGMTIPGGTNLGYNAGFHNETVGSHSFKIPAEFERKDNNTAPTSGTQIAMFQSKSDGTKVLSITATNQEINLETFAEYFSKSVGSDGEKITINGKPTYKFKTTEYGATVYLYILTIDGQIYNFVVSESISDPEQFVSGLL